MEQTERIRAMEARFDTCRAALAELEAAVGRFEAACPEFAALSHYMQSGAWQRDFEADEAGALPPGLPRGVLSEDGVFDLLERAQTVARKLGKAFPAAPASDGTGARPMEERDRAAVLAMMRAFYASPAVLTDGSDEIFENDVSACLGGDPNLSGFVYEENGELLGYAMTARSFSTEFGKPCVWLEDLFVAPAARGRGVGRALLSFVLAKHPGAVFRLEAERENEKAVRLYEGVGFAELPYYEMIKIK